MSNVYEFNPDEILSPDEEVIHDQNKTIERLQEQIEEANKLILWCARISWTGNQEEDIFDKYLSKWGVK